jgi:UMF1 family MFS transporter
VESTPEPQARPNPGNRERDEAKRQTESAPEVVQATSENAPAQKISRLSVAGWVSYDLGNTMFSFNIISLYLPLWVVNDMGGQDSDYGLANSVSMGLMFLTAPLLGAISDQARGRLPFLAVTTLICVALTFFLGQGGVFTTLVLFAIANYFYQAGLIFYDALLPAVSTPETRGRISGIGIGIGYCGSFLGLAVGYGILAANPEGKPLVFQATALFFLLFALPCFLFVREPKRADAQPVSLHMLAAAIRELRHTAGRVRQYRGLGRFLIGRIFYADAANTLITFMGIYVTNEVGFAESEAQILLLSGIAAGIVGGLTWGPIVDRIGPKRTLDAVLVFWLIVFILVAAIGGLGLPGWLFWIAGPLAGIALGGTWTADRPLMIQLAPPRYLGQFYGLYAMVGRFASITGPLLWSLVVDWLGLGRPVAVLSLALWIVISMVLLRGVPAIPRVWGPEDLVPTEQT